MSDEAFDPPTWTRWTLLASVVGAAVSWWLDGPAQLTNALVVVAGLTVVSLLYLWGQDRDPPGGDGGGGNDEREAEVEAQVGAMGYG